MAKKSKKSKKPTKAAKPNKSTPPVEAVVDKADTTEDAPKKRRWLVPTIVAACVFATSAGAVAWWLSGSGATGGEVMACISDGSREDAGKCPPKGKSVQKATGLVQKSEGGTFTLQEMRGSTTGKPRELYVREPDRPYIDLAHANTHAALGQPVDVYFKKVDGKDAVVYMTDSALLGMG